MGRETTPATDPVLFIDHLLVRHHFVIEMIWWTCLAPWEFELPFPGSLMSTFLYPLPLTLRALVPALVSTSFRNISHSVQIHASLSLGCMPNLRILKYTR